MKGRKERRKRAREEGGEEGKVRERTEGRGREGGKKEEEGKLQYEVVSPRCKTWILWGQAEKGTYSRYGVRLHLANTLLGLLPQ